MVVTSLLKELYRIFARNRVEPRIFVLDPSLCRIAVHAVLVYSAKFRVITESPVLLLVYSWTLSRDVLRCLLGMRVRSS